MADGAEAFPNAWSNYRPSGGSAKGAGGYRQAKGWGKGKGKEKGKDKGNAKGNAKGKGKQHNQGNAAREANRVGRATWDEAPDFEVIELARREELEAQIVAFSDGAGRDGDVDSEVQEGGGVGHDAGELSFPPSLTPLERRFVYSVVERLGGMTARGVGPKSDRRIVVSKGAAAVPVQADDAAGAPPSKAEADGQKADADEAAPSSADVEQGAVVQRAEANGVARAPTQNHQREALAPERRAEFEAQLRALLNGTEPSATPRKGDKVQVIRVLGADPRHLEGRVGEVVGEAQASAGASAFTVWFAGDGAAFGEDGLKLTFSAADLRVFEAIPPLGEGCLKMPASLSGLERKAVHEIAEKLGLTSQSFGERSERYITVFRPADRPGKQQAGHVASGQKVAEAGRGTVTSGSAVRSSGVDLDAASTALLLQMVATQLPDSGAQLPFGWRPLATKMVVCNGPLQQPSEVDHRRPAGGDALARVATLQEGEEVELRVVSLGRDRRAIAVGVLGIPAASRNPNIAVAVAPNVPPYAADSISQWTPWQGPPVVLKGRVVQWKSVQAERPEARSEAAAAVAECKVAGVPVASDGGNGQPEKTESCGKVQIKMTEPGAESWWQSLYPADIVADVKARIAQERAQAPADRQQLLHSGRILGDDVIVKDLELTEQSFFVLLVSKPS